MLISDAGSSRQGDRSYRTHRTYEGVDPVILIPSAGLALSGIRR